MVPGIITFDQPASKLLLALVLEHQENVGWKCALLDEIAFGLAHSLFGENGKYVTGDDVQQLKVEAIAVWQAQKEAGAA